MAERGLSTGTERNGLSRISLPLVRAGGFLGPRCSSNRLTFLVQRLMLGAGSGGGGRRSVRLLGNLGGLDIVRSDFDRGAFEAPAREEQGSLGGRFLGGHHIFVRVSVHLFFLPRQREVAEKRECCGWMGGRERGFAHLCERDVGLSVARSFNASNLATEPAISISQVSF